MSLPLDYKVAGQSSKFQYCWQVWTAFWLLKFCPWTLALHDLREDTELKQSLISVQDWCPIFEYTICICQTFTNKSTEFAIIYLFLCFAVALVHLLHYVTVSVCCSFSEFTLTGPHIHFSTVTIALWMLSCDICLEEGPTENHHSKLGSLIKHYNCCCYYYYY